MEDLVRALEIRKKVTQKALNQLNELLEEIKELYNGEKVKLENLILNKKINCPRGNSYYADVLILEEDGWREEYEIVADIEDLDKGSYAYGDYNCWRNHLKREHLLFIFKNLRKWIEEKTKEEKKFTEELESILSDFCKKEKK